MEALLLFINLIIMLGLVVWSARVDSAGKELSGRGAFDMKPGAECDHRPRRQLSYSAPDRPDTI
jgi:hypothetical protein